MNKIIKQRKCKNCKNPFTPFDSIGVCSMACALDFLDKRKQKEVKEVLVRIKKEHVKKKKEFYEQDIKWQHKQCKLVFNKLRRLQEFKWFADRGLEPSCISCAKPLGGDQWACGHFRTVGSQGALRYDVNNTYLQHNYSCNKSLSGDINGSKTTIGYKRGLIQRFGEEEGQRIIDYCENNNATVKWVWQDMKVWRQEWNKEIRELEKCLAN